MRKKHPREFRELREKEELEKSEGRIKEIEKTRINKEVTMNEGIQLNDLITEAKEKTNERRGLLAPPLTETEIRIQRIANVHLRMLEQWRLMLLTAQDNTLQKIIDSLTQKVKLDEDIQQAVALETLCVSIQPVIQTHGLLAAANELVYKEFKELGVEVEKPTTPTINALLKEIEKRVAVGTAEKRKKVKGEE